MVERSALRRGDIYWIETPDIPRRPACVLTRDPAARVLTRPVVVTATGTIRNIPTEVRLGPEDGMPRECVLALDNIERVSAAYFQRYITSLSSEKMREVCRALGIATGCQPA